MRQGAGAGSTNSYYLLDQQHSVIALTAADGNTDVASYAYDPWGVVVGIYGTLSSTSLFWWQGYYENNSQLYKMGARYYNASTGTFTQPDPSGQEANPYAYAGDNPMNNIDPDGLDFLGLSGGDWLKVGAVGLAGAAVFFSGGTALGLGLVATGLDVGGGFVNHESLGGIAADAAIDLSGVGIGRAAELGIEGDNAVRAVNGVEFTANATYSVGSTLHADNE